jgi:DNA-binding CsgD family transcriptional regulator/tetratricopeptide (TPR) repeat protein
MLLGRRSECGVIDRLLADARRGESGVLVIQGEPGVGKTALLDYAAGAGSDLRVARTAGAESEMELPFAALHRLFSPLPDQRDRLPGPQREALEITFGMKPGDAPDRFLVALAVLGALADVAEALPLLCIVDDAHWLDLASAQTLAFVARRLLAESVVIVFATRMRLPELLDLPEMEVEGLGARDARELLASVLPGPLDEDVVDRFIAETHGNPLALLELPSGMTPGEVASGFGGPLSVGLPGRIEESFRSRRETLPGDTQLLLLIAAAEPAGDPAVVWRAADRLGVEASALEPAERAELLNIDSLVHFRHPLVRREVYRAATPEQRREVHTALAEVTDAEADPDRRAWQLSEAASGADESVASELERASGRAQERGGLAAAAAFIARAAALTPDPHERARRTLVAAQAHYEAGSLDDALTLLGTIEPSELGDRRQPKIHLLRAQISYASRRSSDAAALLLEAAGELEAIDPGLARSTYLESLNAAVFGGCLATEGGLARLGAAALAGPPLADSAGPNDLLLKGLATWLTDGYAAGAQLVKDALRAFRADQGRHPYPARSLFLAGWAAAEMWDADTWSLLTERQLARARETGELTAVPSAIGSRSILSAMCGELRSASSMIAELREVRRASGMAPPPSGALWLPALGGRESELEELVATVAPGAEQRGEGFALAVIELVTAVLYNGLGRYEEALTAVRRAPEAVDRVPSPIAAVVELVEAAARCGEHELAATALDRVRERTQASGTDWALGIEARSRALVSEGETAEQLYQLAIARLGRTRLRVDLARAHLLYGEWLRGAHRRLDAREQLRAGLEAFTAMGTEAFAQRAERELLAAGERARERSLQTPSELTSQETQIARMARDGLSNAEIGERLFISQHTVAYHLRKVFSKLGVSRRSHIAEVLPGESSMAPQR